MTPAINARCSPGYKNTHIVLVASLLHGVGGLRVWYDQCDASYVHDLKDTVHSMLVKLFICNQRLNKKLFAERIWSGRRPTDFRRRLPNGKMRS